jgi:hypothetical protein
MERAKRNFEKMPGCGVPFVIIPAAPADFGAWRRLYAGGARAGFWPQ